MSDAPERIWAYNSLQTGYRFTAKGPQPHFDGAEYIRADLLAELMEALRGLLGLLDAGSLYEPQVYRARAVLALIAHNTTEG